METGHQVGRRGRGGREWYWNYFEVTLSRNRDGRQRPSTALCTLCRKAVSPKIERIREHFSRFHPELVDSRPQSQADQDQDQDSSEHLSEDCSNSMTSELEADPKNEVHSRMETASVAVEGNVINEILSAVAENSADKDWVFKYYTSNGTEGQVKCNLCEIELISETTLLVNHLFDLHSEMPHIESAQQSVDVEKSSRRTSRQGKNAAESGTPRRPKASVWNHFETIMADAGDGTKTPKVKCKVCQQIVSPKVERLRRHILENHAELADEETEERFLASKEATKMLIGRGEAEGPPHKSRKLPGPAPAAVKSLSELTMKKDAEGKRALIWSYFQLLHSPGTTSVLKVIGAQCKICETLVSPKIERLRRHFLNHHADILIGSDDFDVQTVLDEVSRAEEEGATIPITIKAEGHNKTTRAKNEMDWTKKYFDIRDDQAQCRLCLDVYDPHMESLHEHLKVSHQGILEFCDSVPDVQFKKENTFKDTDIEPIETTAEFEWEDAEEMLMGQEESETESSAFRCLICENILRKPGRHTASIRSWDKGCAESLCQIFSLDDSYSQCFESGKYCRACQQLVRNIDFTQRAINRFRTLLSTYRHSYESLLHKKYEGNSRQDSNEAQNSDTFRTLYRAIFKATDKAQNTFHRKRKSKKLLSQSLSSLPRRQSVKRRKVKVEISSDEEFLEEQQTVVEYTSKYGRTCTSLSLREFIPEPVEMAGDHDNDHDDMDDMAVADAHDDDDWTSPKEEEKKTTPPRRGRKPGRPRRRGSSADLQNTVTAAKPKVRKDKEPPQPTESLVPTSTEQISKTVVPALKPRPKFTCEISGCTFSCYQKTWLEVHIRSRHENDEMPYHCECGEKFGNMTSYGLHQRKHILDAKKRVVCLTCKKTFDDKVALKEHRDEVHKRPVKAKPPEYQRCPFCSFIIVEDHLLPEHEKLHEIKVMEKLPYDCVICNSQVFTNTMALQTHVKTVHNPVVNGPKCEKCDKVFKSGKILRRHNKRAHLTDEVEIPNWKCSECGIVSANRAEHRAHFKIHVKPRPFLCAECGMTFKSKSNLRIHNMLHTGERPWKCKLCPKGFNQSSKLRAHEETHVEMKTYVCDKCGKAFRTARNIYQHQKFHCHPDGPLKSDGSMAVPKKRRREQNPEPPGGDSEDESSTSLVSMPPVMRDENEDQGQFQNRHHLTLPPYLPSAGSTLGEMMTIDTRGSGIPFIGTHGHHAVQSGYNVPIWIAHGQQSLTLDSNHHTGRM